MRAGLAQQAAHRNEFVTLGAKAVDNLRQSGNGMAAVAAAIVHQNDVSLSRLSIRHYALNNRVDRRRRAALRFTPIVRIDLRSHDDVTHGLRNRQHGDFAGGFGLMIDPKRRPKKESFHSQVTFQKQLSKIQLELKLRIS